MAIRWGSRRNAPTPLISPLAHQKVIRTGKNTQSFQLLLLTYYHWILVLYYTSQKVSSVHICIFNHDNGNKLKLFCVSLCGANFAELAVVADAATATYMFEAERVPERKKRPRRPVARRAGGGGGRNLTTMS